MDVPDLVRQAVGDEEIRAGVNLGDEDAVVFTPSRTLVYRGEGLLSDEDVETYGFDFERLAVSEGRRKTKFTMTYVDAERSFTVPGKRTDDVLEKLIEGTLRVAEAIAPGESVTGVFRFSEMTLVVTEGRLLKHIGEYTWDSDFEAFDYDDLTKLAFEEGSVATQVVLSVGNRSERIKAPNAEAGLVRKTLQEAVFSHHGVGSLEELNRKIAVESDDEAGASDITGGLGLDSGIDPLVSDDPEEGEGEPDAAGQGSQSPAGGPSGSASSADARGSASSGSTNQSAPSDSRQSSTGTQQSTQASGSSRGASGQSAGSKSSQSRSRATSSDSAGTSDDTGGSRDSSRSGARSASGTTGGSGGSKGAETDEVLAQLSELTQAVERQNKLLDRQQQIVQKLIEELRQGR